MPQTINVKLTIDQMIPQHCDDPPYRFANTLASEELTFLRMRSSQISHTEYSDDMTPMNNYPSSAAYSIFSRS